ncbi:MAG: hypothetical protein FJ033_08385 [Chloroflexi bacterium]|nr:hypothetical protein [Chloroflexota bacterium]
MTRFVGDRADQALPAGIDLEIDIASGNRRRFLLVEEFQHDHTRRESLIPGRPMFRRVGSRFLLNRLPLTVVEDGRDRTPR